MGKILVIGPFNDKMKAALQAAKPEGFEMNFITSRDEYGALADVDYVILRTLNLNADDIASMKKVKLIQRWGAGYDTVDIKAAAEAGIPVAVCYGLNSTPVSEMALALTLAVYRNIVTLTNGINEGKWEREIYGKSSYTIHGKTAGIVGIGNIGRKVAALYQAFGAKVIYYDAFRLPTDTEAALGVEYCELDDVLAKSDIVSLHVPLLDSTAGMINEDSIRKMKDGAILINTAREELVDLDALKAALISGKLAGAGIDAFNEETIAKKMFAGMNNVTMTPHLGGNTADDVAQLAQRCMEHVDKISRGEEIQPPHMVNKQLMK